MTPRRSTAVGPIVALTMWVLPAQADAVADFYRDKTITLISAGEAGGAHGTYAQVIAAAHQEAHPGQSDGRGPVHARRRRQPGAELSAQRRAQGRHRHRPAAAGSDLQRAHRRPGGEIRCRRKAHYLGGADITRTTVSVMKASGIATLDDARRREVLMGSTGKSGQTYIIPMRAQRHARHQIPSGHRLSGHQLHPSGDGARRDCTAVPPPGRRSPRPRRRGSRRA